MLHIFIKRIFAVLVLFMCFLPLCANSSELKAELSCSPETATVGDVLNITLKITSPKAMAFEVQDDFNISDLELINTKQVVTEEKAGNIESVYQYEAAGFSVGVKKIGPVKIILSSGSQIQSNETSVEIKSVLTENDTEIKDIKKNIDVKLPAAFWVQLAGIIILLSAAIYFISKLIKSRIENKKTAETIKTPEEIADQALDELSNSDLIAQGKVKEYYTSLAEILKTYIDARYSVSAMDSTTTELYKALRNSSSLQNNASEIKDLLQQCDMVKFAKFLPETHAKDLDETKKIYSKIKYEQKEGGKDESVS